MNRHILGQVQLIGLVGSDQQGVQRVPLELIVVMRTGSENESVLLLADDVVVVAVTVVVLLNRSMVDMRPWCMQIMEGPIETNCEV